MRATAFTFETCHHALSFLSSLTRSISVRSLRLPRTGTLIRIRSIASAGVSLVSRSASSATGRSIRSAVSLSIATFEVYAERIHRKLPLMDQPPVELVVEDDLRRNRLTVFFRLFLAIPHLIWSFLWSIAMVFAAIANWIATLIVGRPPASLHTFSCAYVRYLTHLNAYFWLVGNPYPGFVGEEGEYPVDVTLPPPAA